MDQFFNFLTFSIFAAYGIRALAVEVRRRLTGKDVDDF
jgi:hypothetical protein